MSDTLFRRRSRSMSDFPTPSSHYLSLPLEINAATRNNHILLNRLIIARLPLCLPPNTRTTGLYTTGLSIFGTIYTAFEKEWERILDAGASDKTSSDRTLRILGSLHMPRLLRSDWLRNDLMLLEGNDSSCPKVSENIRQYYRNAIMQSIQAKPFRIMAYAWVMYMALFNGGRWMRAQLIAAGSDFWRTGREGQVDIDCLTFWHFDSVNDGDDIKDDFRRRFDQAAAQLTTSERADVVRTAVGIFQICQGMAEWLDEHANNDVANKDLKSPLMVHQYDRWYERAAFAPIATAVGIWIGVWTIIGSIFNSPSLSRTIRYTLIPEKDSHTE